MDIGETGKREDLPPTLLIRLPAQTFQAKLRLPRCPGPSALGRVHFDDGPSVYEKGGELSQVMNVHTLTPYVEDGNHGE